MDVFIDKSKFSEPITTGERAVFHMFCEDLGLVDICWLANPREKDSSSSSTIHWNHILGYTLLHTIL